MRGFQYFLYLYLALFCGEEVETEFSCFVLIAWNFLPRLGCLEAMVPFCLYLPL